jgi:hypothetical protein
MRFRFRTLLILIAVIGLVLAIVMPYYQRYRAICIVEERGGFLMSADYEETEPQWKKVFGEILHVQNGGELKDQDFQFVIRHLPEIQSVGFYVDDLSLETIGIVCKLSQLKDVSVAGIKITSEQLEGICQSQTLSGIDFSALMNPFTDEHFAALSRSKSLQRIDVSHTWMTARRLELLMEIPKLEYLEIKARDSEGNVPRQPLESLLQRHPSISLWCRGVKEDDEKWWTELQQRFPGSKILRLK